MIARQIRNILITFSVLSRLFITVKREYNWLWALSILKNTFILLLFTLSAGGGVQVKRFCFHCFCYFYILMSSLRGLVWHDIYHKSVIKAASEILESETGISPDPEYYLHLLLSRQLLEKRIIYINNISQLFTITFASFFLGNSFLLPNSASPFIT